MEPLDRNTVNVHVSAALPGALNRALRGPFQTMENVIRDCGLNDAKTLEITDWLRGFRENLRGALDEQTVYARYIASLHLILRDPFTEGPLEPPAVLGREDGVTYGLKALIVVMAAFPEDEQHLSLQNGQPLTLVDHPVVNHMIGWLEERGQPLGYSVELAQAYENLIRQPTLVQRVNHLMQLHIAFQRAQQEQQEREVRRLEERLIRMRTEREEEMQAVAARVEQLKTPLQQLHQEVRQLGDQTRTATALVQQQMQTVVQEGFVALNQRVIEHRNRNETDLAQVAGERREQCLHVEGVISSLEARVVSIQQENRQLALEQERLQQNLDELARQQQRLDHNIQQLHDTITRNKKRQNVLRDIGMAVLSVIVTIALQEILPGTSINFSKDAFSAGVSKSF